MPPQYQKPFHQRCRDWMARNKFIATLLLVSPVIGGVGHLLDFGTKWDEHEWPRPAFGGEVRDIRADLQRLEREYRNNWRKQAIRSLSNIERQLHESTNPELTAYLSEQRQVLMDDIAANQKRLDQLPDR